MNRNAPPVLACRRLTDPEEGIVGRALSAASPGGWVQRVGRVFELAPACRLRQAWLVEEEKEFVPGTVRVARTAEHLVVFAELTDRDIHTRVTGLNQRAWELGDTFEMFFQREHEEAYVEFHVVPNNAHLQLRFPNAAALARCREANAFEECLLSGGVFESAVAVVEEAGGWFVLARIPAVAVGAGRPFEPGSKWRFSFSRYDYTRGRAEPVISSSSPHAHPNFHHRAEWGWLTF